MKKLFSLILALALCLGLSGTALAEAAAGIASGADNILPDAWAFFNQELTHSDSIIDNGKDVFFQFAPEQTAAAYEYAMLLSSGRFGFTLTDIWTEELGGGHLMDFFMFDHPGVGEDEQITQVCRKGDMTAAVILCIQDNQSYGWGDIFITYSDALTVMDTGDRCTFTGLTDKLDAGHGVAGPMGSGTAAADMPVESWDGLLPDPGAFFQCGVYASDDPGDGSRNRHYSYYWLGVDGEEAVKEYLALLNDSRFHLEQYEYSGSREFSWEGTTYTLYRFDYVGSVPDVAEIWYSDKDYPGNVFLSVDYHYGEGYIDVGLEYGDGLTLADPGDRASELPQDMSGSPRPETEDDPGDSSRSGSGRRKCSYCDHGTRTCLTCDGKGYIEVYVSVPNYSGSTLGPSGGWEHHDCPNINCDHGRVDCNFCGGDGWID